MRKPETTFWGNERQFFEKMRDNNKKRLPRKLRFADVALKIDFWSLIQARAVGVNQTCDNDIPECLYIFFIQSLADRRL